MKVNSRCNVAYGVFGVASLAGGISDALAQESAGKALLEEVVVTARKTEESQQVVPVSITALTSADLQKSVVLSVTDLQAHVPGLVVSASSKGGQPNFGIRVAHTPNGQEGSGITAYVDDVPMHSTYTVANMMYDLDSVATLKGPQGTLFGTNATGGAFVFRPKKPTDTFEGYAEVGAGNWDRKQFQGMVNVPVSEAVQLRVAGEVVRRDGFVKNLAAVNGNDELNDDRHESARVTLRLKPTSTLTNDLMVLYYHEDGQPKQAIPVAFSNPFITSPVTNASGCGVLCEPFGLGATGAGVQLYNNHTVALGNNLATPNTNLPTWKKIEIYNIANTTEWQVSDNVSFKNVLAFQHEDLDTFEDSDGTSLALVNGRSRYWTQQWSEEASLHIDSDDKRLRFVGGTYLQYWTPESKDNYTLATLIDPSFIPFLPAPGAGLFSFPQYSTNQYERELRSKAAYAQIAYDFTDQITATFGLRYNWDSGKYRVHLRGGTGNGNTALGLAPAILDTTGEMTMPCRAVAQSGYADADLVNCDAKLEGKWKSPSWTFSLQNQISDRTMLYFTTRGGYQAGGFNNEISNAALQVYKPEKVVDFETGIKADWDILGRPIRTNFDVFYGRYNDIQRVQNGSYTSGGQFSAVFNAGSATYYGTDLEVSFFPIDMLEVSAAWNHLETEYDKFVIPAIPGGAGPFANQQDLGDSPLAYAPKDSVTAQVTLSWPVPSDMGDLSTSVSYYFTDKIHFGDVPTTGFTQYDAAPSYSLFNLSQDWKNILGSRVDLSLWVKNVFDKDTAIGWVGNNQMITFGYATYIFGDPRTMGANIRFNF